MSKTPPKTADFLRAMQQSEAEPSESSVAPPTQARTQTHAVEAQRPEPKSTASATKPSTRVGLKHFGGYLDDETLEKIALLRVRLKLDNSELIKLAIDELHSRHNAKRKFGDA